MADEAILPASLEKLEIGSQRDETHGNSNRHFNPFKLYSSNNGIASSTTTEKESQNSDEEPALGVLSLSGEKCSSTSCQCNKRHSSNSHQLKESRSWSNSRHIRSTTRFKRCILQKSKLDFVCNMLRKNERGGFILKEPVLKLGPAKKGIGDGMNVRLNPLSKVPIKNSVDSSIALVASNTSNNGKCSYLFGHNASCSHQDFKSLLCNSSCDLQEPKLSNYSASSFQYIRHGYQSKRFLAKTQKNIVETALHNTTSPGASSNAAGQSCSQQARMTAPTTCDDVTIDELASYFDDFVYIPKKMSHMAEMMYI